MTTPDVAQEIEVKDINILRENAYAGEASLSRDQSSMTLSQLRKAEEEAWRKRRQDETAQAADALAKDLAEEVAE